MGKDIDNNKKPGKKKSFLKKLLIIAGSIFVLFVILLISIPYFFKDDIIALLKNEINDNINAKFDFRDIDVSLIKDFPDFSLTIKDMTLSGKGGKDTLFKASQMNLSLDLMQVLTSKKELKIKKIILLNPQLRMVVDAGGQSNFDILKPGDSENTSQEETPLKDISLQYYAIENADISYTDKKENSNIRIRKFYHSGKGDFRKNIFDLHTETHAGDVNVLNNGIAILKHAIVSSNLDLGVDTDKKRLEIKNGDLHLNALTLVTKGYIEFDDEYVNTGISLKAPGNDFKEIFSLIPNAYISGYENIKAAGNFSFSGNIQGKYYFEKEQYPDFDFNIESRDGYIKYPDFKIPLENINSKIHIYKKGDIKNTTVDIKDLTFTINKKVNRIKLLLKNIAGNIDATGSLKGNIDFHELTQAFPLSGVDELQGTSRYDLAFAFDKNLTKKRLDGNVSISDFRFKYTDMPGISIKNSNAAFQNEKINIGISGMKAGDTDINATATVTGALAFITDNGGLSVNITGKSHFVNADEWMAEDTASTYEQPDPGTEKLLKDRIEIIAAYDMDKVKYEDYDLQQIHINTAYRRDRMNIQKMTLLLSGSPFDISGYLFNITDWLLKDHTLKGKLDVNSTYFDLDKFMATGGETSQQTAEEEFELPENMDIVLNTKIDKLDFEQKKLYNLKGKAILGDRTMTLDGFSAKAFGGIMALSGNISTPANEKPAFDLKYNMSGIRYEEIYKSVVSYRILSPVSKYIHGIFNANFDVKGKLDKELTPELTTLTATGIINTLNAYIKSYPPLQHIADKLQITSLKDLKLKNTKSIIEILNGTVKVKPFDVVYDGMKFNISGINKLDKTIDYKIIAHIPAEKIKKLPGGKAVDKGLDYVLSLANKAGLKTGKPKIIKLLILLKGDVDKPDIKIRYAGSENVSLKDSVEDKADDVVKETKDKINKEYDKTKDKVKEKIDSTKNKVKENIDKTKKKLKDKTKEKLKDLDSTAKKNAKKLLDKYNPFKK